MTNHITPIERLAAERQRELRRLARRARAIRLLGR